MLPKCFPSHKNRGIMVNYILNLGLKEYKKNMFGNPNFLLYKNGLLHCNAFS